MAVTLRPAPAPAPAPAPENENEHDSGPTVALPAPDRQRAGDTPPARARRPLTPLAALTAAATAALGVVLFYMMGAIFRELIPPMVVLGVLSLAVAAVIVFVRRAWTPLLGSLAAVLLAAGLIIPAASEIAHTMGNPNDPLFGVLTVLFPCLAVGFLAGIAATVQRYRWAAAGAAGAAAPSGPRWLVPALIALGGLIAGANLVAAIPQKGAAASVSPDVLASLPALSAKGFAFEQPEVRVKAGQLVAMRLQNGDAAPHSFDVDALGVHAPIPVGQDGVALFRPTAPGTYVFYCAPHFDKETGQGMHGTLIVE
jgi:plastocyanin